MRDKTGASGLIALISCLHKKNEWAYEKEWRLAIPGWLMDKDSNYLVPKATGIYLGMKMNEADVESVTSIATAKQISLYKARSELDTIPKLIFEKVS